MVEDTQQLVETVCELARHAGEAIMAVYAGEFAVETKQDASPLTQADLAAHQVLVQGLQALTPDWPVLSEESAYIPWQQRARWSRYWLVDPLDGTREFVKRNDEFTVNVALIENSQSCLGVVLAPVTSELAWAWKGAGCWYRAAAQAPTERIRVRSAPPCPVVASSRSHTGAEERSMLDRLGQHERIALGSSLKFLRIGQGQADLYLRLGPTSEWDTAAAQCVLEEAGGAVLDTQGHPLRYNTKESLLNPSFIAVGDQSVDWLSRMQR